MQARTQLHAGMTRVIVSAPSAEAVRPVRTDQLAPTLAAIQRHTATLPGTRAQGLWSGPTQPPPVQIRYKPHHPPMPIVDQYQLMSPQVNGRSSH